MVQGMEKTTSKVLRRPTETSRRTKQNHLGHQFDQKDVRRMVCRHGDDAAASAEADRVQAIREIEMLYEDAELVAKQTGELDFFAAPIEDLLKKPTHVLLNWLSLWK